MNKQREALELALNALVSSTGELHLHLASPTDMQLVKNHKAIAAIREALAEPEQEPVAWMLECPTMTGSTAWILSWSKSGAGMCNRLAGVEHERALYAAPRVNPPPIGYWNGRETAYFEHELVGGLLPTSDCTIPIYVDPPARKSLTDEQIQNCKKEANKTYMRFWGGTEGQIAMPEDEWQNYFARAIERAHGITND